MKQIRSNQKKARAYLVLLLSFLAFAAMGQTAPRNRISGPIENGRRMTLSGHVPTKARPEDDQGPVDSSMRLRSVTLALKPSASQQADLDRLLDEQQDPSSPNYHHWLTPDEYAE